MKKLLVSMLFLALLLGAGITASAFHAQVSAQNLSVNGQAVQCEKYNIDGSNYFKLRDLAKLLDGTGSQFDVGWDEAAKVVSITTSHAYTTPNGQELVVGKDNSSTAQVSSQTIKVNGKVVSDLTVYNIGGSNYFKLREMGDKLGFDVDYDASTNTAIVTSKGEAPAPAQPTKPQAESVSLSETAKTLKVGDSFTLTATVLPADAENKAVTWTSSAPSVATVSNGQVKAVAAGSAKITASTANGKTAACAVTVEKEQAKPIEYSGNGDQVITGVNLPQGNYYAEYTHSGKRNFISKIYYGPEKYDYESISNKIGAVTGQTFLPKARNQAFQNGTLEVKADGAWTIRFLPVQDGGSSSVQGQGDTVTGYFTAQQSGRVTCSMRYSGEHNFIARLYTEKGNSYKYESLVNEIGSYSGQVTVNLTAGQKYFYSIIGEGSWSFTLGGGQSGSSGQSSGNTGTIPSSGPSKDYSYDDVNTLYKYVCNATDSLSSADSYSGKAMTQYVGNASAASTNIEWAKKYLSLARTSMGNALTLAKSRSDILLTNGEEDSTLTALIQSCCDAIDEAQSTEVNGPTEIPGFYVSTIQAGTYAWNVRTIVLKMLGSFVQ